MDDRYIIAGTVIILWAYQAYVIARYAYKVGYYEQKLRNLKDRLNSEEWKQIHDVMTGKRNVFTKSEP
jgi:hypothetical protein